MVVRAFLISLCAVLGVQASGPSPATTAAFDRYTMLVEQQLKAKVSPNHFLWLDEHQKEKSLAWFSQDVIVPMKMLDEGNEIPVPDGVIQDWLGAIYLDGTTIDKVRDVIAAFSGYKDYFKQEIVDSKQVKREGDHWDASVRIYKKQLQSVALNVDLSADYTLVDPARAYFICRSTRIAELEHPNKKTSKEERSPEDEHGYLWRLNLYWRLKRDGNGVYAEVELVSLSHDTNGNRLERLQKHLLNGFVEDFPRSFVADLMDGMRKAFPTH